MYALYTEKIEVRLQKDTMCIIRKHSKKKKISISRVVRGLIESNIEQLQKSK